MTFWFLEVFVLALFIEGAHAFSSPELSSHRGLSSGQSSLRLKPYNEDYTVKEAPPFRLGNEPDNGDGGRRHTQHSQPLSRRMLFASRLSFGAVTATSVFAASSLILLMPEKAAAAIDTSSLQTTGDASGAALRLKQLQAIAPPPPKKRIGWVELDSGVSYREFDTGIAGTRAIRKGVQNGYNVGAILTIRTLSEDLLIYSNRGNNDLDELSWKVGSGDFPKGAEEGMMGMRLGSTTQIGKERYEEAFRSGDATLVFDVRITGIQPGDNRQGKVSATR
eukprot:CAMPEP_0194360550 /NCGR_PEP_ID=MMETSP0174-20130528/7894_1 /TAXON_ID=216777 /ORGANISM="Proboscia alata, Strain PI-D3" /LENGTH=277 /DNA_ID=CAMNT_0039132099 /DNA_START=78 /DNA_END=911 /DNA_ORIENTATION=-